MTSKSKDAEALRLWSIIETANAVIEVAAVEARRKRNEAFRRLVRDHDVKPNEIATRQGVTHRAITKAVLDAEREPTKL